MNEWDGMGLEIRTRWELRGAVAGRVGFGVGLIRSVCGVQAVSKRRAQAACLQYLRQQAAEGGEVKKNKAEEARP